MSITVTRYGGIMAMKPLSKTVPLESLDPKTREALLALMKKGSSPVAASRRMPDAFSYSFKLSGEDQGEAEVEVSGPEIPEALRKLLP